MDDSLYPLAVLIDELKNEEVAVRACVLQYISVNLIVNSLRTLTHGLFLHAHINSINQFNQSINSINQPINQ